MERFAVLAVWTWKGWFWCVLFLGWGSIFASSAVAQQMTPERRAEIVRLMKEYRESRLPWEYSEFEYKHYLCPEKKQLLGLSLRQSEEIDQVQAAGKKKFMDYHRRMEVWLKEVHPFLTGRKSMTQLAEWSQGRVDLSDANVRNVRAVLTKEQKDLLLAYESKLECRRNGFSAMLLDSFRLNDLLKGYPYRSDIQRELIELNSVYRKKSAEIELKYEDEIIESLPEDVQKKIRLWLSLEDPYN